MWGVQKCAYCIGAVAHVVRKLEDDGGSGSDQNDPVGAVIYAEWHTGYSICIWLGTKLWPGGLAASGG